MVARMKDLRSRMRRLRKDAGLSQRALGELIGESQRWASSRETGETPFALEDIYAWAEACEHTPVLFVVPNEAAASECLDQLEALEPEEIEALCLFLQAIDSMDAGIRGFLFRQLRQSAEAAKG